MMIQVFWGATPSQPVSNYQHFRAKQCFHLQGQAGVWDCFTLKMEALHLSKMSATTHDYQSKYIPAGLLHCTGSHAAWKRPFATLVTSPENLSSYWLGRRSVPFHFCNSDWTQSLLPFNKTNPFLCVINFGIDLTCHLEEGSSTLLLLVLKYFLWSTTFLKKFPYLSSRQYCLWCSSNTINVWELHCMPSLGCQ
jgi:hypothetical protein